MKEWVWILSTAAASILMAGCSAELSDHSLPADSVSVLDPLWTAGAAGEPNALFQSIRSLAASPDGTVAVADLAGRVALFDSVGDWIRDVGTRGEGPGEYRQPTYVDFAGDSVVVWDMGLRRLSWYSIDGGFLGSERVLNIGSGLKVRWGGNALVAEVERGQSIDPDPATSVILRVTPGELVADTLAGPYPVPEFGWEIIDPSTQTGAMVNPPVFSVRPPWEVCSGELVWADPVGDSVVFFDLDQRQSAVLRLDSPSAPVSEEDIERFVEASRDRWSLDAATTARLREETSFAESRPSLTDLVCGTDGELWLAGFDPSALYPAEGVGATWRVMDRSGSVRRVVEFPQGFHLEVIQGSMAYGIGRTDMGVEYLSAFRLPGWD